MRVTSGQWRGTTLIVPRGEQTRPTADKIRQALFNMLRHQQAIIGAVVLDAFCGSGAMGIEALSNGAKKCYFWDIHASSVQATVTNVRKVRAEDQSVITKQNALEGRAKEAFDLIFLDPPYHQGLVEQCLAQLIKQEAFKPGGFLVIEKAKEETIDVSGFDLILLSDKVHGSTSIQLFQFHSK